MSPRGCACRCLNCREGKHTVCRGLGVGRPCRPRPTIGVRIVRGLRHILAVACAELESGNEGYFGTSQGFDGDPDDVRAAVRYLDELVNWFDAHQPPEVP